MGWREILIRNGIPKEVLTGKHSYCPLPNCGGKDRFRYTNYKGKGNYFCNVCGSGDGINLLMKFHGWSYREVFLVLDPYKDLIEKSKENYMLPKMQKSEAKIEADKMRAWTCNEIMKEAIPVCESKLAVRYIESRGISPEIYNNRGLLFHPSLLIGNVAYGCIIVIFGKESNRYTIQKHYLNSEGTSRVAFRMVKGSLPKGSYEIGALGNSHIQGVAEGVFTAMSAEQLYGHNVCSVLNCANMVNFYPPENYSEIIIYTDNDKSNAGQNAASLLYTRLLTLPWIKNVRVEIPSIEGTDYNDILLDSLKHNDKIE